MDLKVKVINELNEKLKSLQNTNDKNKLKNHVIRMEDLQAIIRLIKNYEFIEKESLEIDDILLINPEGDNILGKVFYTKELLKFDIDIITIKIVSDIICYRTGICAYTNDNKILSYIYLYLLHLTLIDVSIKYYAQNIRSKLYELLQESDNDIIEKYDLNFSQEKLKYYINFAIKNYKTHLSFYVFCEEYNFHNGNILAYDKFYSHVTETVGIEFMSDFINYPTLLYGHVPREKIIFDSKFDVYKNLTNKYKEIIKGKKNRYILVDQNYNLVENKNLRRELNEQFKVLKSIS